MAAVEITYSAEVGDLDRFAHETAAERTDKPLRLRIQPTLLRGVGSETANHRAWPGVSWTLECKDAAEAIGVRKALEQFFTAVAKHGAAAVEKALTPSSPQA